MKAAIILASLFGSLAMAAPACVCEQTVCIDVWPQSCHCANQVKQKCFEKCGGLAPQMESCPPMDMTPRAVVVPKISACVAGPVPCTKMFPMPCECRNRQAVAQFNKCGGDLAIEQCAEKKNLDSPLPREVAACQAEPLRCAGIHPITPACQRALAVNKSNCAAAAAVRRAEPVAQACSAKPLICSTVHPRTPQCLNAMALNAAAQCPGSAPHVRRAEPAQESCHAEALVCSKIFPITPECRNAMIISRAAQCGTNAN